MSATNVDRIRDYFHRQWELEEGNAEENVFALFAKDAIIQLDNGDTVTIEDIARSAARLRQIPKSERILEVSDFKEEGDTVSFHSFVRFPNPATGELSESDSDVVWRFNDQGEVVESKSSTSIASLMPPSRN
ncbi:MAG TPA: nuclear transport factor 2 family protein [Anaerolineae bacterium]|nr:nuclear transport factor 2 family protein [Anaerolineae bacterium]